MVGIWFWWKPPHHFQRFQRQRPHLWPTTSTTTGAHSSAKGHNHTCTLWVLRSWVGFGPMWWGKPPKGSTQQKKTNKNLFALRSSRELNGGNWRSKSTLLYISKPVFFQGPSDSRGKSLKFFTTWWISGRWKVYLFCQTSLEKILLPGDSKWLFIPWLEVT